MSEVPTASLAEALVKVQAELPEISKTETAKVETKSGGSYSYRYADLANITHEILPLLAKHGLAWMTKPTLLPDHNLVLEYTLLHVSGERETGQYPLISSGTPQQRGGEITYARRYTLCSVTGVAPDQDDDDAAAASEPAKLRSVRRQNPEVQAQPRPSRAAQRQAPDGPPLPGETSTDGITAPQLTKLHAALGALGLADRDKGLAKLSEITGREVRSSKELTKKEASKVIEELTP